MAAAWMAVCLLCVSARGADQAVSEPPRERVPFDSGWRFSLGHAQDTAKDFDHATAYFSYVTKAGYGDGPAAAGFDDRGWRLLDLPHDWAVEAPFSKDASHSHGYKAVGRKFPERSIGWYRKTFTLPAGDLGRRISVEFDGVFRDSVVWINGFYLGRQPSGETGFRYDLSDYLNYGGTNVLVVRADATMEEGWYYEGAGIYRHVWLTKTSPLHIPQWGVFARSVLSADRASVTIETEVVNEALGRCDFEIDQSIISPTGEQVAHGLISGGKLPAGGHGGYHQELTVTQPRLWSLEDPALHRVVTLLRLGGKVVDRMETSFGIRQLRFDPDQGFFLNGRHVYIKGANMHQDHAGVGTALPDSLHEYRIRRLKDMGMNACRTSHQPPTPEFLDTCDRLGFLVLDENRLMGPSPEQLSQLEAMIRRDRNHPSVFVWSLGNEEWAIEGNELGARISASMRAFAERLDPSRRTTVAISGGWGAGSSTTADVMGYNYYTHGSVDEQHAKFPLQPSLGTEETSTQCTRGIYFTDASLGHLAHDPEAKGDSGGNCIKGMKFFSERPFVAGFFYWTGFDYRGESNPFKFPAVSSQYGLVDTCGFAKDSFYYLKSVWTQEPVLHLYPHWNWQGREGQLITVGAYSNHEEVELLLNGRSLGRKPVPALDRVEWKVPYEPGVLEARGFRGGAQVAVTRVETTGSATKLVLRTDRASIKADGLDATVVAVEAQDAQGRFVPVAGDKVRFIIEGGRILGVGNGDPSCLEPDQFHSSVVLLQAEAWSGRIVPASTSAPAGVEGLKSLLLVGDWLAPLPKPEEIYALAASIRLEQPLGAGNLRLVLPNLGLRMSVWLNGRELVRDLDTHSSGPDLPLDPSLLVVGDNRVELLVVPFEGRERRLPQKERLGCLRLELPAPQVSRSLFNGLAQVVVQATAQAVPLRLHAEADGLQSADVIIGTEP